MSTETIGKAAGTVWKRLFEKGATGLTVAEVKKTPGFSADEAIAGLGWLAREGKLCFREVGKKQVVSLVDQEICATV